MFINKDKWEKLSYKQLIGQFTFVSTTSHVNHIGENNGVQGTIGQYLCIKCQGVNKVELEAYLPTSVEVEEVEIKGKKFFRISKAGLTCCKNDLMNNPCRQWAKIDQEAEEKEYDVRLLTTLFATAGDLMHDAYKDARINKYQHDKRGGKGKAQQFFNWFYDEDGYPGRVDYEEIDFLRSTHKEAPIIFLDPSKRLQGKLTLEKGIYSIGVDGNSALNKAFNPFEKNSVTGGKKSRLKLEHGVLKGNFNDWQQFSEFLLGEGKEQVTTLLRGQQRESILKELKCDQGIIDSIEGPMPENQRGEEVNKKIAALQNSLQLFSNEAFFKKFTKDKGVLQAEQYFSWLCANIHAEIDFLKTQQSLPQGDAFKGVHEEINQLLSIHDFLLYKCLVHRDAHINITKKEASGLFSVLKSVGTNQDALKNKLSEHYVAKLLNLSGEKDLTRLTDFVSNYEKLNKGNQEEFLGELKKLAPDNIKSIKISTTLRIKEVLYNFTYYIPGSSLWLKYLYPARNRVESNYKGARLYPSNREIEESKTSKDIRGHLNIDKPNEFFSGKHEAKCLISEFRKDRNMIGAKEKFIFKIKKNRFIWLPICIGVGIVSVTLSIISRVLIVLHVIPPSPTNGILNGFRGFTESFAFIFGLDTLIDLTVLRALDFVALGVRYIDQYLLGSVIRTTLRLITGIVVDIFQGIKYGIKACFQSLIDHGLFGSLVIAADNVKQSFNNITKENIKGIPRAIFTYARDKMFTPMERSESYGFKIPGVCLFYNLHRDHKGWKEGRQKQALIKLQESINQFFREKEIGELQEKHEVIRGNLNELAQKGELIKFVHASGQIQAIKQELHNFTHRKGLIREKIKDFSQIYLLKTNLLHKQLFPGSANIDCQNPSDVFIQDNDTGIKKSDLQKRINIIDALIKKIDTSKVDVAQQIAEPIFTINNEHKKLKLGLEVYKSSLEKLSENFNNENQSITPVTLGLLDCQFRNHLSNAFVLMNKGFNELEYSGFHGRDLQEFIAEFGLVALFAPSSEIKEVAANLRLYTGRSSSIDIAVKRFMHFAQEYQDPKRLLICFLAMSALQDTRFHTIPDAMSGLMDVLTGYIGMNAVHHIVEETAIGKFINMLYEKAELPRDLTVALIQCNDTLCDMEGKYKYECHELSTEIRVKGTVNTLFSFLFTIIGINTIKSVAAEKGYDKRETLQKCYVPYFAAISLSSGLPVAVLIMQQIMINVALIYTLFAISAAATVACFVAAVYSLTLPSTQIDEGAAYGKQKSIAH